MTKQFLTREKFKTALGRQMYDELIKINQDDDWLYIIFYHCKGDENKKHFLEWLNKEKRTILDITKYLVK